MCRYRWSRCFGPTDVTDTDGCRCSENKKVTDADACRCFGSTDVFRYRCLRCLWFTDVLPILMPNICWCIRYGWRKFPDSDRKFPGSQVLRRPQSLNMRISSGQPGFPRVNDIYVPIPMFTDVLVHKCLPMQMFTDVCGSPMLTDVLVTDVWGWPILPIYIGKNIYAVWNTT